MCDMDCYQNRECGRLELLPWMSGVDARRQPVKSPVMVAECGTVKSIKEFASILYIFQESSFILISIT